MIKSKNIWFTAPHETDYVLNFGFNYAQSIWQTVSLKVIMRILISIEARKDKICYQEIVFLSIHIVAKAALSHYITPIYCRVSLKRKMPVN